MLKGLLCLFLALSDPPGQGDFVVVPVSWVSFVVERNQASSIECCFEGLKTREADRHMQGVASKGFDSQAEPESGQPSLTLPSEIWVTLNMLLFLHELQLVHSFSSARGLCGWQ